jgi:hypothetical protein
VSESRETVRILKLAAAQRQLDAAIRMTFAEEHALAITAVAAAAYRVLHDIKAQRGHVVLADEWRDGMLGVARALANGTLTEEEIKSFKAASDMWSAIVMLAEQIKVVGADRKISELRSIVDVHVPTDTEKGHWRAFCKVPNFLKHAEKDHDKYLSADEVNPDNLILAGCNLYMDLCGLLMRSSADQQAIGTTMGPRLRPLVIRHRGFVTGQPYAA